MLADYHSVQEGEYVVVDGDVRTTSRAGIFCTGDALDVTNNAFGGSQYSIIIRIMKFIQMSLLLAVLQEFLKLMQMVFFILRILEVEIVVER